MRRLVFLLLFSGFIFSCKETSKPQLSPQKMQQVLLDIHFAEASSVILNKDTTLHSGERNLDSLAIFYSSVFKHHNITAKEFEESLNWYKQNPEELDTVYAKLIPEMSKYEGVYR